MTIATPKAVADLRVKTVDGCSFCEELLDLKSVTLPVVNRFFQEFRYSKRILLETEAFFVVPSLGALMPGHVLLLPKRHYYSVGEMNERDVAELGLLAERMECLLQRLYGFCSSFEHGCVKGVGKAGACIDHAHLHMLPLKTDLREAIRAKFGPGTEIHRLSELGQFASHQVPYLYYRAPEGSARGYEAQQAPSQFFRQLICSTTPTESPWDWKRDVRTRIVEETYESIREGLVKVSKLAKSAGA